MLDAIKNRRSVREYQSIKIPNDKLAELIEAAKMAPSPFNLQPWKFYIIKDEEKKKRIREIYDKATKRIKFLKKIRLTNVPIYDQDTSFLENATLIVPCYDKNISYSRDALAMAVENLILEAAENQLGSVCMGRPTTFNKHKKQIKQLIRIPKNYEIPYIVAVGLPTKSLSLYKTPEKKSLNEIMEII